LSTYITLPAHKQASHKPKIEHCRIFNSVTTAPRVCAGVVFVGGFSYADVLDSAKGWAGTIRHNPKLDKQFTDFYDRHASSMPLKPVVILA